MPYSGVISSSIRDAAALASAEVFNGGTLEILDSMDVVLLSFELDAVAASVALDGVVEFNGFPKAAVVLASGDADSAQFKDSEDAVIVSGLTVDLADAAIILDSLTLVEDDIVVVTSLSLTVPASFPV